jgi:purine nucleoside phosphorylase
VAVGIVTGSGTYALPDFEDPAPERVETPWGAADVTRGRVAGVEVVHLSRHGDGHVRLSNHVEHRANVAALAQAGATAVIGCTACGAVDPEIELGTVVVFDDLHFPANRLPDGSICTFHAHAGDPRRGHWIYESPFCEPLRAALVAGAQRAEVGARDGGCYGHVDGPRFNTRTEIAQLAEAGVSAVSQTAGPETVLCGEAELPYALMGFATDYANGVMERPTPLEDLVALMQMSTQRFAAVLAAALPGLEAQGLQPSGTVLRFEQG